MKTSMLVVTMGDHWDVAEYMHVARAFVAHRPHKSVHCTELQHSFLLKAGRKDELALPRTKMGYGKIMLEKNKENQTSLCERDKYNSRLLQCIIG